jgi:DNA-binding beta-propeller fold protein YncE
LARLPSKAASGNGAPRQPTRLTRRRLLLAVLVFFVAGIVATALDLRFVTGGKPRAVLPNSLLVLDPHTLVTIRNVPGQRAPFHAPIARGGGLLWTVDGERNRLMATKRGSEHVVREVVVGTQPVAVATGFGAAWVANAGSGSITRVELAGSKVETVGLNDQPSAIATGAGYVWVVSVRSQKVLRIDPDTNLVTKTLRLSRPPRDVVVRVGRVLLTIGD